METIIIEARSAGVVRRVAARAALAFLTLGITAAEAALPGYQIVESAVRKVEPGQQHGTRLPCPSGKYVVGGGATIVNNGTSALTNAVLNSSAPSSDGKNWMVYVNNFDTKAVKQYKVHAICTDKLSGYTVVRSSGTVARGAQMGRTALCPAGTVVVGGGVFSYSSDIMVRINSTFPVGDSTRYFSSQDHRETGWAAYMNNLTTFDTKYDVYAICARSMGGWEIVRTNAHMKADFTRWSNTVACSDSAQKSLSGGVAVAWDQPYPDVAGSSLTGFCSGEECAYGWHITINNRSFGESAITTYAICANERDPSASRTIWK